MTTVHVNNNDVDRAIKTLRNKVNKEGTIRKYKASRRFIPKSKARRKGRSRKSHK